MPAAWRRFTLTAHVTSSVGWLGAVGAFLSLAVAGLTSRDAELVRACYLAMNLMGWFVVVPLSIASLVTGLVQSLSTQWGLLRHYWVLIKLLIGVFATLVLVLHMQPTGQLAQASAAAIMSRSDLGGLRIQLAADAGAALFVLIVATALGIYKPRGQTPHGLRKQRQEGVAAGVGTIPGRPDEGSPRWAKIFGLTILMLVTLFVALHLTGHGLGAHGKFGG